MVNPLIAPSPPALQKRKEEATVAEESKLKAHDLFGELPPIDDKYKELALSLPADERWETFKIWHFKGFWQGGPFFPGVLKMQEEFKPQPSDVIVSSFSKAGTTWLKALVFTLMHRDKYDLSSHPLLKRNPHDVVPFVEHHYGLGDEEYLESLPSPRVLGTHIPYSVLPESIRASTCPIIYICRDPKDIIVSYWHMMRKMGVVKETFSFDQAFELFCEGRVIYGPVWEHVLEYYKKSLDSPKNILFLKYEEMMNNPGDGAMRVANFIGCPFSDEEVKKGLVEQIVEFCSFKKLKELDVNKDVKNEVFFRKAVIGDWRNYMTPEMAAKLDEIFKEKMRDSGLTFGVSSS